MKFAQKDLDTVAKSFGIYLNQFESSSAYKRNSNLAMTDFLFANNFNVKSLLKNWESMLEGDDYTGQDDQSVLSVYRLKTDSDGNIYCETADGTQEIEFVTKGKDKGKVKVLENTGIADSSRGIYGDPHYATVGKNGNSIRFDYQGTAGHTYNVFSGDNISINALHSAFYKKNPSSTAMTELSIKISASNVTWTAGGKPQLNGQEIQEGKTTLSDGSVVTYSGMKLSIIPNDGTGEIVITNKTVNARNDLVTTSFFNIDPSGKFFGLGGILGTAIEQSRALTTAECDAFEVTNQSLLIAQA